MSTVTFHIGDVRDRMAEMPDSSVDLIVTSPPFLALRSYLPADHPDKHREIGSEPTPAHHLDTLLALTAEWRRLLTPTGSLAVELGDTYAGSVGFNGTDQFSIDKGRGKMVMTGSGPMQQRSTVGWPLPKSLCGIPQLYQLALTYGINPLTGQESPAGRWRIRNLLVWTRPNPPVGALGDKFRPATSYVTAACTSAQRWFDLDAVRSEALTPSPAGPEPGLRHARDIGSGANHAMAERTYHANGGAPPLDWHHDETQDWQPLHRLPTAPYPGAHYATYPLALPRKLIEAMCPRQVCTVCGEPRRRIGTAEYVPSANYRGDVMIADADRQADGVNQWVGNGGAQASVIRSAPTLGWTDCECPCPTHDIRRCTICNDEQRFRPGMVLDPFAGSGTTLLAAALCGRNATGIDIDTRNCDLTYERLRDAAHITTINTLEPFIWSVDPDLPGIKHEHPDQQSLFA